MPTDPLRSPSDNDVRGLVGDLIRERSERSSYERDYTLNARLDAAGNWLTALLRDRQRLERELGEARGYLDTIHSIAEDYADRGDEWATVYEQAEAGLDAARPHPTDGGRDDG